MEKSQLREGEGHGLFTLKNILLLILGFVIGYLIKGQAVQNITIGYDDYKIVVKKEQQSMFNVKEGTKEVSTKEDAVNKDENSD